MKKPASLLIALIMAAVLAACGGGMSSSYDVKNTAAASSEAWAAPAAAPQEAARGSAGFEMSVEEPMDYDDVQMDEAEMGGGGPQTGGGIVGPSVSPVVDSRKIIKNVYLEMQTLKFDEGVDAIAKIAEDFGGFVQDSYVQGRDMYNERGTRHASFTIRIPSERLDAFVNSVGGEFNVISKSQNSQDVTETYFDSKARLDALKIQEERLLEMLSGATELEYMLQVEDKLMNVRYEIESLTSQLNRLDSFVSMSTVNISLYEVVKYEPVEDVPVTFGERISRAFSKSLESFSELSKDAIVTIVFLFPLLLFIAAVLVIVIAVRRRGKKRRAAKAAGTASPKPAAPPSETNSPKE